MLGFKLVLLVLTTVLKNSVQQTVYGEDFLLYPSQDGSNNLVPAFLKPPSNFTLQNTKDANENDIHFYLYTPSNASVPIEIRASNAAVVANLNFVKNAPLKIICHGFASSYTQQEFPAGTRIKYLAVQGPINVIVIDWQLLARAPYYFRASFNVVTVGRKTAELINVLVQANVVQLGNIHLVGHSLGAHIVAIAARGVTSGKVARVTGLDPASPLWADNPDKISSNVAQFVDIIHTNARLWGIPQPLGLVDFYPNGGDTQTGCDWEIFGVCSHERSYQFFTESIVEPAQGQKFDSCLCKNCQVRTQDACFENHFLLGTCSCSPVVQMGDAAPTWSRGTYYLVTNPQSPFSK